MSLCVGRALWTQRGFWASVGGGATAIGSWSFSSQRLAAANCEMTEFIVLVAKSGLVEQVDL